MSTRKTRALRAALAGAFAMLLAGCTSTVAGVAVMATQQDADSAVGPLLDTGRYPTTVGHPVGTAGSEAAGAVLEAQRMAEYVVGPWEVDAKLRRPNFLATRVAPDMQLLDEVLPQPIRDVASAHGVITTFATSRSSSDSRAPLALTNLVMRFPDPDAAVTAATEMGDKNRHVGDAPRSPIVIHNHPEAVASAHDYLGDRTVVDSFTAHGPYVLYQGAQSKKEGSGALPPFAAQLTEFALGLQQNRIDQFVSTDPAKLADMPLDPTGKMLARTLATSDGDAFLVDGVWQPRAWLHFEGDPIAAAARYVAAGVEVVVNRLTTVYQTNNPRGAAAMVDKLATNRGPWVKAINGVPNLPAARCSTRKGASVAPTLHEIAAHFRCVASADRYAFIAYSDSGKDAKQQIAAQYRILAGK